MSLKVTQCDRNSRYSIGHILLPISGLYTVIHKKRGSTFIIIIPEILMDFNNSYKSGNGNKCPLQMSYLLIYFTCDISMTSLSLSWHWWAATASAACVTRLGAVADWWRSWLMANTLACLCSYQWWTTGHFEHTFWLSICFLCTWWTLCFTPRLMQWVILQECIMKVWNVMFHFHKVV